MSFRKFESDNDKRKRKRRVDALIESQRGSIDNFFKSSTTASMNPHEMAIVAMNDQLMRMRKKMSTSVSMITM